MPTLATAQEFLTIFNQLEQHLTQLKGTTEYIGLRRLVEQLSKSNGIINFYKHDLIEYVELRNALVHKSTGRPIAEPHQEVVDQLKYIYRALTKPLTALEIAKKPVYTTTVHDLLSDVLSQMAQHFYHAVPVYVDNRFVGVLSQHSIVKWVGEHTAREQFSLSSATVGQLQQYFDRPNDKYNAYVFVSQNIDAFTIRESFMSFTSEKKRLGAVFVTEHGNQNEPILGIITAWDLPKVPHLDETPNGEKIPLQPQLSSFSQSSAEKPSSSP